MRSIIFIALLNFLLITPITAQVKIIPERENFNQFDWECSLSTSLGISKTSTKISGNNEFGQYFSNEEQSPYSELLVSVGFFVIDGLSIEPEINFTDLYSDISVALIGNVSYTINIPRSRIYPFIKLGYGVSGFNGGNHQYGYNGESDNLFGSLDASLVSASLGIKIVSNLTNSIRIEINYKHFSNNYSIQDSYNQSTQLYEVKMETLAIIVGGSILF